MALFKNIPNNDQLENMLTDTLMDHLGIKLIEFGEDYVKAAMPVGPATHQPLGYLHGGASLALAESVGSIASYLLVDSDAFNVFGLEINANHIRSIRKGQVFAIARPLHLGKQTHVWDIRIEDEHSNLISIVRLTTMITPK